MSDWGGTTASSTSSFYQGSTIYIRWYYAPPSPPKLKPVFFNPYAVLGLADNAPLEQVRSRYRDLAKIAHPDRGGNTKWMAVINRAYDHIRRNDARR